VIPQFAAHHLWWLAVGGAGVAARYVQRHTRPLRVTPFAEEEATTRLLHEQSLHGYNAHSLVSIAPGARFWSCPEIEGGITYNEFGKVWLVPGDPLGSEENVTALAHRFIGAARDEGRIVAFMPATARFARQASMLGLRAVKISAAPYFDLTSWGPRGDRAKKARAGVNQARRAGVSVIQADRIDRAIKEETAALCESWLKTRRCAMKLGWLFALDPFQHAARKRFFVARDASGNLVGFLAASPIPARDGWYLEDILRLPNAPSGTADLLVVEALSELKRSGAKLATLGTSPLATDGDVEPEIHNHELVADTVRNAARCFAGVYNFEGLRRFKAKFAPSWWESEYVLFPRELAAPPHIIRALIQAIAPDGASKLLARQIVRAIRRDRSLENQFEASPLNNGTLESGSQIARQDAMNRESTQREIEHVTIPSDFGVAQVDTRHYFGQFVSVNGLRMHYVSKGQGRPVVFIHGNPGSHQDFSMTVLGEVAQSYRALAFDRPGHGYSERRGGTWTTVEVQALMLRQALKQLSIEKPLIVGHSWGGALALTMAVQAQTEFAGLVLLAPAAYPGESSQWWTSLLHVPVLGNLLLMTLTPLIGRGIVRDSLKEAYHPEPVQEEYVRAAEAMWTRPEQVRACAYDDKSLNDSVKRLSKRYKDLQLPVVIVTGDSDLLVSPQDSYKLHHAIPRAELIRLEGTGHQILQTRPESVIEAIDMAWALPATNWSA
jgi:pimeloyl-ACP methyl ester carboxylesterase